MKLGVIKNKGAAVINNGSYALLSRLGFNGSLEQLISAGDDYLQEIKNSLKIFNEYLPLEMKIWMLLSECPAKLWQ
jgi:hypothetical protein